ncbi:MAG TPA: ATP-binding protein [Candidatus Angelobacter sp.]|jgi:hypothetical protein|nr:ATP-binding protein [Candidatus Angelobacter sp.]
MSDLSSAHRGYEYQDLLAAIRLVDVLLNTVLRVWVDEKLVSDDRFDDLTTEDVENHRERTQCKYTDNQEQPLTLATFTSDARGLRLNRLVVAAVADRDGPGRQASRHRFRVVLRDSRPTDHHLIRVLKPAAPDPGAWFAGMNSYRMQFDADELMREHLASADRSGDDPFKFLRDGADAVAAADLNWFCQHTIVEVEAPASSRNLLEPGPAEQLLIRRLRDEVGAGLYPNEDRQPVDVGEALIRCARSARQKSLTVAPEDLFRRTQLRQDFGAVARSHPVDKSIEVARQSTILRLVDVADSSRATGGTVLLVGPPGQGKSWVCQQFVEEVTRLGWAVAEHYCYLGDADGDRSRRVMEDTVFGSLLNRLGDAEPRAVSDQRPRFAADADSLVDAVDRAVGPNGSRAVALVVDGLDHVTRVSGKRFDFDPTAALAESLASLNLPTGSVLVVLSQPGGHLTPLEHDNCERLQVPALDTGELRELAERLGAIPQTSDSYTSHQAEGEEETASEEIDTFLSALAERSAGNALYATYLCRESSRHGGTAIDAITRVRDLPPFDGTLLNYYEHLVRSLGDYAWVSDLIALLDFPVTGLELKEIRPDAKQHIDKALEVLAPVLTERSAQGGIRVYHESFARFLRRPFQDDPSVAVALLEKVATWLAKRGLFDDFRAFRFLLPVLADSSRFHEVVDTVPHDFATRALAAGFPASAINANLAVAVRCASRIRNWPAVARFVEMARGPETMQFERFSSAMVDYADVPVGLLGSSVVASRLLYDGSPVMSGREGMLMCSAVDALGGVVPWREYMEAFAREAEDDNTSYGAASEKQAALAWLRGRLRLSSMVSTAKGSEWTGRRSSTSDPAKAQPVDVAAPVHWSGLAKWVTELELPPSCVVTAVADTYGTPGVERLIQELGQPGEYLLAFGEEAADAASGLEGPNPYELARMAVKAGVRSGRRHRLLRLGIDLDEFSDDAGESQRQTLLDLTRRIQEASIRWDGEILEQWLDAVVTAARRDPLGLAVAEALVDGIGWYRCWLRFVVSLARAEALQPEDQTDAALEALQLLTQDLDPFAGTPRACDLFPIHSIIQDTVRRALALVADNRRGAAVQLLDLVSRSLTTTMRGMVGGPLPPDRFLVLAAEVAPSDAVEAVQGLVQAEIENGAGRYYEDLAQYSLIGARLALRIGDRAKASALWAEACQLLLAYGWRKDITIYEALDPLGKLIDADRVNARVRLARVQPLCERVVLHTDGKETRHAIPRWWQLLAEADPAAVVRLVAPDLFAHCNDPNLLFDCRTDLWRAWHLKADPLVSGVLRLCVEETLDSKDAETLERLVHHGTKLGQDVVEELTTLLVARADERAYRYGVSNSDELVARDSKQVDAINAVAAQARLPRVGAVPTIPEEATSSSSLGVRTTSPPGRRGIVPNLTYEAFAPGRAGLGKAIRAWRRRPYGTEEAGWEAERFSNVLGYRILWLAQEGRRDEAEQALRLLADGLRFGEGSQLLGLLGQGLVRCGEARLATLAFALAWTRARGGGGWLTFGGETDIELLRSAAQIDHALTLEVIGDEVEQRVAGAYYGTYGIAQALTYAFLDGGLGEDEAEGQRVAFEVWDEICDVIAYRTPRINAADDPDHPYVPPTADDGQVGQGDIDETLAAAAMLGVAHASREEKRRSLLATRILLRHRPGLVVEAVRGALQALSDPGTLSWLLAVLATGMSQVPERCTEVLERVSQRPHLTVRVLARRLLSEPQPLPVPVPDPALSGTGAGAIVLPSGGGHKDEPSSEEERADAMVVEFAGHRLFRGEQVVSGLADAVQVRVRSAIEDGTYKERIRRQLDAYGDRLQKRWPDAYTCPEETVETALQLVAGGARAVLMMRGEPIADPGEWESDLAAALADDPTWPLAIEATRHPRPPLSPPPGPRDPLWQTLRAAAAGILVASGGVCGAIEREESLSATLSTVGPDLVPIMEGGRFDGWRVVGVVEHRVVTIGSLSNAEDVIVKRYAGLETLPNQSVIRLSEPPLAVGDVRSWTGFLSTTADIPPPDGNSTPMIGIDYELRAARSAQDGLGIQRPLLAPSPGLVAALHLRAGDGGLVMEDDQGPALALVTWRTEYERSDYHLPWPRLQGAAVAMRQTAFDSLRAFLGGPVEFREFLLGDPRLCPS